DAGRDHERRGDDERDDHDEHGQAVTAVEHTGSPRPVVASLTPRLVDHGRWYTPTRRGFTTTRARVRKDGLRVEVLQSPGQDVRREGATMVALVLAMVMCFVVALVVWAAVELERRLL